MTPPCPECVRTRQRSTVRESARSRLTVGAVEVTTRHGKRITAGTIRTGRAYLCSKGHRWCDASTESISAEASLGEVVERVVGGGP